jgi:predicted nucleotidyltransferase
VRRPLTGIERLLGALSDAGVQFILVGGVAARAHGSARITQDVDVSYSRTPENLEQVVRSLAPFKPYLRGAPRGLPFEWSAATLKAGLNFTLTTTVGDIDLLGEITGGGRYEDLVPHSEAVTIFGRETLLLNLPWLIHVKRAAGRPKDLEVIAELEALMEERGESPGPAAGA